ncbi:hypothetical protein GCM10011332_24960 [Terasakiella brassicae]|uniref:Solute-binding protein family 3/N-terminal domain-containing protein n=1 Tax=Terasakiella brassicae TaxID=1634917 RepID=A0A917FEF8_9PROT|nr:TIGR02285 family protein [Terasakiella brassicae]GGF69957.1 hypothetical protein GCM10011332_24960 [Terasakiella brassicae]
MRHIKTFLNTFLLSAAFLLLLAGFHTGASAKPTLNWATNDLIPFYINDGAYKEQGISDQWIRFFETYLPQYQHIRVPMNMARFYAQAEQGDLVCNPLLLKTKNREAFLAYSNAMKPAYAHILVSTHPIDYPEEGISLSDFIKADPDGLIVQAERSYGPILDRIIDQAIQNGQAKRSRMGTQQLFTMIEKGRIIHFLDIENSVTYYNKMHTGTRKLYNIPIKEDRLERFGYLACTKSPEGQRVISAANKILKEKAASPELRTILESWMVPENLPRFRRFYDLTILNQQ